MEERKERSIEERIEQTSEGKKERKGKQGRRKEGRKELAINQSFDDYVVYIQLKWLILVLKSPFDMFPAISKLAVKHFMTSSTLVATERSSRMYCVVWTPLDLVMR